MLEPTEFVQVLVDLWSGDARRLGVRGTLVQPRSSYINSCIHHVDRAPFSSFSISFATSLSVLECDLMDSLGMLEWHLCIQSSNGLKFFIENQSAYSSAP